MDIPFAQWMVDRLLTGLERSRTTMQGVRVLRNRLRLSLFTLAFIVALIVLAAAASADSPTPTPSCSDATHFILCGSDSGLSFNTNNANTAPASAAPIHTGG